MPAVTKARKIYLTRKASLVRLLDPIQQLTQGEEASMERLIEYRDEFKVVWDQFAQAHDELVEAHPEDEDPDAEGFGSLEMRRAELMGTLAEVITRLNTERLNQEKRVEDEQAQRDRQAELNRQQEQKVNQVAARRLRLANLHVQAKDHLNRLLRDISQEEVPSSADLMTAEQVLINARVIINSANKQSMELAEMDPDLTTEVLEEDVRETASFNKLEKEVLLLMNKHKAYHQSLNPPSSHPAGGAATTTSRSFKFEKRTLPKFGGTLREYPTFKKDWTSHVLPN